MSTGYYILQLRYRTCPSLHKVLLDWTVLRCQIFPNKILHSGQVIVCIPPTQIFRALQMTCWFIYLNSILSKQFEKKFPTWKIQIISVQLVSGVLLFATPWIAACQASLSITNSQSSLKLISVESVMPSNHLILCRPLLFLPSIFPSIGVFSSESVLCIRWPKFQFQYQSFP